MQVSKPTTTEATKNSETVRPVGCPELHQLCSSVLQQSRMQNVKTDLVSPLQPLVSHPWRGFPGAMSCLHCLHGLQVLVRHEKEDTRGHTRTHTHMCHTSYYMNVTQILQEYYMNMTHCLKDLNACAATSVRRILGSMAVSQAPPGYHRRLWGFVGRLCTSKTVVCARRNRSSVHVERSGVATSLFFFIISHSVVCARRRVLACAADSLLACADDRFWRAQMTR